MDRESALTSHPLINDLSKNMQSALEKSFEAAKKPGGTEKFMKRKLQIETTKYEEYNTNVFKCCLNIVKTIDRIWAISVFISAFPTPNRYAKFGIKKVDWINYHNANFAIAKVSLNDMVLLLLNQVFELGLKPQNCKTETVIENKWIKNLPKVTTAFKALEKATQDSRNPKNLYIHRGITPILEEIDLLEILEYGTSIVDFDFPSEEIKKLFKMALKGISKEIKKELANLEKCIVRVFDVIENEYNKRIDNY